MSKRKKLNINESLMKKVRFAGSSRDDIAAYHKAYLMGSFEELHTEDFAKEHGYNIDSFEKAFRNFMNYNSLLSVTLFHAEDGAEIPVGIATFWKHGRIVQINHTIWFPWSKPRQRLESSINLYDTFRKSKDSLTGKFHKVIGITEKSNSKFFQRLIDLNIVSKIGEAEGFFPDETAVFLTTNEVTE